MSKTANLNINIEKSRKAQLARFAKEDRFTMTRVVENLIDAEVVRRKQEKEVVIDGV